MSEIVELLLLYGNKRPVLPHAEIMLAAAAEIERLRTDVAALVKYAASLERAPICLTCGKPAIGRCEATSSIYHRTSEG